MVELDHVELSSSSVSAQCELNLRYGRAQFQTKKSENGQTSPCRVQFDPKGSAGWAQFEVSLGSFELSLGSTRAQFELGPSPIWVQFGLRVASVWAQSEPSPSAARAQSELSLSPVCAHCELNLGRKGEKMATLPQFELPNGTNVCFRVFS